MADPEHCPLCGRVADDRPLPEQLTAIALTDPAAFKEWLAQFLEHLADRVEA